MFGVADYADNLAHLRRLIANRPERFHLFADRVLVWKIFLREPLINNNDLFRGKPVGICEKTAMDKWDAHGLEIVGSGQAGV